MQKESKEKYIAVFITLIATFVILFSGAMFFQDSAKQNLNQTANANSLPNLDLTNVVPGQFVSQDLSVGSGQAAKPGDQVFVHYSGYLTDGTKFDSSLDRNEPISFVVGQGQVIKGFDEGVVGLKIGGKRRLIIPYDLGYGENPVGPIPANSTLVFDVELVKIGE